MKKQLLLALMLFAFIFLSKIAEVKDTCLNSLQEKVKTSCFYFFRSAASRCSFPGCTWERGDEGRDILSGADLNVCF